MPKHPRTENGSELFIQSKKKKLRLWCEIGQVQLCVNWRGREKRRFQCAYFVKLNLNFRQFLSPFVNLNFVIAFLVGRFKIDRRQQGMSPKSRILRRYARIREGANCGTNPYKFSKCRRLQAERKNVLSPCWSLTRESMKPFFFPRFTITFNSNLQ